MDPDAMAHSVVCREQPMNIFKKEFCPSTVRNDDIFWDLSM
jgi:hypothetical protein